MFKRNRTLLEKLKNQHPFSLENLPQLIQIEDEELNIEHTTLDQLAFAILALENEVRPMNRRLSALRELYDLARKRSALGAQRMEEIFAKAEGL